MFIYACSFLHLSGIFSLKRLHECAFHYLFRGVLVAKIQTLACEFVNETLDQLLYDPAIEQLNLATKTGHLTVLLSSSPQFLVEPIAKRLGISQWKSTEYGIDDKKCYSHIAKLMLGEDKALYVKELDKTACKSSLNITAYSDSYYDLPFLLSAKRAVGVNPDRKLRAFCMKQKWPII